MYSDLICSVEPSVMTVADRCYSQKLISSDMYDQLIQCPNWTDTNKTRNLLNNISKVISRPSALKDFVTILSQVDDCRQIADKIQQKLQ